MGSSRVVQGVATAAGRFLASRHTPIVSSGRTNVSRISKASSAIALGDQVDQPEPLGGEDRGDEQERRAGEPREWRERPPVTLGEVTRDPLVDRMHGAGAALQQGREDHQLESRVEAAACPAAAA